MPDGFVILEAIRDDAGRIVDFVYEYADTAIASAMGRSADEVLGHQLLEIVPHALDTQASFEEYARLVETNETAYAEVYDSTGGAERWFQRIAIPLRDLLFLRYCDVTARKREERRGRILVETANQLGERVPPEEVLERLPTILVGRFADCVLAYVIESGGRLRRVGAELVDTSRRGDLLEVEERARRDVLDELVRSAVRTKDVVAHCDIDGQVIAAWSRDHGLGPGLSRLAPRSAVVAPVVGRDHTHGILVLATLRNGQMPFDTEDLDCVRTITRLAGRVMDGSRASALRGARSRPGEEGALLEATAAILATSSVETMMDRIAQNALTAVDADSAVIERVEQDRQSIRIAASTGLTNLPVGSALPYSGTLVAHLVESDRPAVIPRLSETELSVSPALLETCGECSVVAVPLVEAGQAIGGLLLLRNPGRAPFEEGEVGRATVFANLASLAFRKVHLLEEARRQREELRESIRMRERLVRGFSHDLKNPLGAARGHLDLLQMQVLGDLTQRQKETIRRIRRAVDETLGLIDEALDAARAETGHLEAEPEWVHVTTVVDEVVSLYRAQALEAGLALEVSVSGNLPVIETDAVRVRQILGNLISNAIKYTPAGGRIDVSASAAVSHDRDGVRWIAIAVEDTGIGIPKERHGELFREFQRIDAKDEPGSGIGLAMSQRLARTLGGGISVESDSGVGSTFTLWLPIGTPPKSGSSSPWRDGRRSQGRRPHVREPDIA